MATRLEPSALARGRSHPCADCAPRRASRRGRPRYIGSAVWFGSWASVALSNSYPEAKSVGRWLRHGWHVAIASVSGFFVMLAILGRQPDLEHKKRVEPNTQPAYTIAMMGDVP